MKHIFFFATPKDIIPVLCRFEQSKPLKFVEVGIRPTPNRDIFLNFAAIPNPGISTNERGGGSATYMVSYRDTKNNQRAFVDITGQQRWSLDASGNEQTVLLTLAGLWTSGTLLPGNMNTLHETAVAQQLMRNFLSVLKQEKFTKIDLWWLGREALEMLKAGKRLTTTAEQSPPEFDLKLP